MGLEHLVYRSVARLTLGSKTSRDAELDCVHHLQRGGGRVGFVDGVVIPNEKPVGLAIDFDEAHSPRAPPPHLENSHTVHDALQVPDFLALDLEERALYAVRCRTLPVSVGFSLKMTRGIRVPPSTLIVCTTVMHSFSFPPVLVPTSFCPTFRNIKTTYRGNKHMMSTRGTGSAVLHISYVPAQKKSNNTPKDHFQNRTPKPDYTVLVLPQTKKNISEQPKTKNYISIYLITTFIPSQNPKTTNNNPRKN